MQYIHLQQTLPEVFKNSSHISSDVWHKDLRFEKGKSYLIEAASGTGKTSLCSYLYGYRNDYQGIITFDETNIRSLNAEQWSDIRKNSLSLLFQELRLFPELTALENVELKNRLCHTKSKQEIEHLFVRLGIANKLHVQTKKMSLGQQQRVAFIRCLCQPYDFIFLDEPISHLDPQNAQLMSEILQEEAQQQKAGIITTSIGNHLPMDYDFILKL